MNKKRFLAALAVATLAFSMVGCGSSGGGDSKGGDSSVANKDKPLCWFNRQPSNSSTGELDKEALSFNDDTYYVGFDANQGAELQGEMVLDYIKENAAKMDRKRRRRDRDMFLRSEISDIMILSHVHVVFVLLLEQA